MKINQTQKIKEVLEKGKTITSTEAFWKYRITRLSGVIYTLRKTYGMNIETITQKSRYGTPYAKYRLKKD